MARRVVEVDVFGRGPLLGNPLAVVLDAEGLDPGQMQAFARWTNFSETTFVLPADTDTADYRVRIYTPIGELPFAGHPSIGTAWAVLDAGLVAPDRTDLVMQCAAGHLPLQISGEGPDRRLWVRTPAAQVQALDRSVVTTVSAALRYTLTQAWYVDVGARWLIAELSDAAAVLDLQPDFRALAAVSTAEHGLGVTVYGGLDDALEVRSFAPLDGINEDPVCGSGNAAVAAVRLHRGQVTPGATWLARQGRACGRDGEVAVRLDAGGRIHIGGRARIVVRGEWHDTP